MATKRAIQVKEGEKVRGAIIPVTNLRAPIWEKQNHESFPSFARFQLYRDVGSGRQFTLIAAEVGVKPKAIEEMGCRWRWKERAEAWDKHLDDLRVKAIEDAASTMASRQAKLGMILQDKAIVALENIQLKDVTPRDAVALAESGVKIERLARGEKVDEPQTIVIQLPVLPGWARGSKFVQQIEPPTVDGEAKEVANDSQAS